MELLITGVVLVAVLVRRKHDVRNSRRPPCSSEAEGIESGASARRAVSAIEVDNARAERDVAQAEIERIGTSAEFNGTKLLEYELGSPDWEARVKASKFDKIPLYGKATRGRIGLQDHGDPVWFRNIKIRTLE